MKAVLDKYTFVTFISIRNNLKYVHEFFYRSLFMLIVIGVFIGLWSFVFKEHPQIEGYSFQQTLWYLVLTEAIVLTRIQICYAISDDVKSGSLAYQLSKPYGYVLFQYFKGLGDFFIAFCVHFLMGGLLVGLIAGFPDIDLKGIFPVLVCILFAITIDFLLSVIIGLLSFYTEDINGFAFAYQKLLFIAGGMLLPIEFYPNWLQNFLRFFPFQDIVFAPAKLFVHFSFDLFIQVIFSQMKWMFILILIVWITYRYGTRRLTMNGG